MLVLEVLSWGALLFWVLVLLDRRRAWPAGQFLRRRGGAPPPAFPGPEALVSAIVPARNEAAVLPRTLPALLLQDHSGLRVVLVDDGSSDGTGARAGELAAELGLSDRLSVVKGEPPPAGWTGKVHALHQGLRALLEKSSAPEWLLLTDADILHPPSSVRSLLHRAETGGHDLVSVMARLRAETFWEKVVIPPFVFFFHLLYPFSSASRADSRVAAAAGGCILLRRSVLQEAGGFEAIAGEVIDDVALARAARRVGGRLWLGLDPEITSVRGYPRLADLFGMVSRTAFTQLRHRWDLLLLTTAALLGLLVAPPILAAALFLAGKPVEGAAALGAWLVPAAMLLPFTIYHRVAGAYALALPAAGLLFLLMTLSSAFCHLKAGGPLWKGRRLGAR